MKTLIAAVVSLTLGLVIGWYTEHRRAEREKTEIVQQMVQKIESSHAVEAVRDVRAISVIGAGDPQQAIQMLLHPIVHYYALYFAAGTNDQRSEVRALIEQLAKTNHAVAARLAEAATNYGLKAP